ncbi:MAG: hypothetical protein ACXVRA_12720, partial [Gaiellaceae bacterium]
LRHYRRRSRHRLAPSRTFHVLHLKLASLLRRTNVLPTLFVSFRRARASATPSASRDSMA